ncbi:MAG: hypothetical protein IKO07_10160 [Clostridia bacterium]|nr:hypothetical protein [Clostridia bacterium]
MNGRGSIDDQGRVYDTEYPGGYPMAIGLVDQDGYVYGKYPPLSRGIGSPDLIGRVDLGTGRVISTLSGGGYDMAGEIGYMDENGEVRLRNGYGPVGYVEPADPRGAAAILLLLMKRAGAESAAGSQSFAGAPVEEPADVSGSENDGGEAPKGVDTATFHTVMAYSLFIIAMLATVIFLKAPGTILAAVEFLIYIIVGNLKEGHRLNQRKIKPGEIGKAAGAGVIYVVIAALVLVIIRDQSPNSDFYLIGGGIIVGVSYILDRLFSVA